MLTHASIADQPQIDGRRMITYRFADHLGNAHVVGPILAPATYNAGAGMLARLAAHEQNLAEAEIQDISEKAPGDSFSVVPAHATQAQLRQSLFATFREGNALESRRFVPALDALTNPQLSAMFSLSPAQITALRARLDRLRNINTLVTQDGRLLR